MIDDKEIMPLNFFKYGGIYSGSHNKMRYRLLRTGEKPDFVMEAMCWRAPYSYDAVMRDEETAKTMKKATFPFTEDGRAEAVAWLKDEYDADLAYYEEAPSPLNADISLEKIYNSGKE